MRLSKKITLVFPIPNDPDKGEVTIIHLLPGKVEDIQETMKAFETVMKKGEGDKLEPELRQNSDLGDRRYLFVVEAIESWKNIKDEDGKDLPCTEEAKIAVARAAEVKNEKGERVTFVAWVNECRSKLAEKVVADREAAEKN